MRNFLKTTTCLGSIALLAACGSSADGTIVISAEEEALRIFAEDAGDIADVLASEGRLAAREVSEATWRENYATEGSDGAYTSVDGVVEIEGDGDDLLVTFAIAGDPSPDVIRIVDAASIDEGFVTIDTEGLFFDLFVGGGLTIADLLDDTSGSGYARRIGIYYGQSGDGFGLQTETVFGTETTDAMIADLGMTDAVATYDAFGQIRIRRDDADWNIFNANLSGDISMEADFGAGTVSGEMGNLFFEEFAGNTEVDDFEVDGSIIMNETSIQANAFGGSLSADAALTDDDPGIGSVVAGVGYSGAFYGPEAEEIGGTFAGGGSYEGQGYLAIGTFTGGIDD